MSNKQQDNIKNEVEERKPVPTDLQAFLPWACTQMLINIEIVFHKSWLGEYVSAISSDRGKSRVKNNTKLQSTPDFSSDADQGSVNTDTKHKEIAKNILYITAVYNTSEQLIELKFEKNKTIPCRIIKLFALIIKFYTTLNSFTINKGLNAGALYELCKILPISNITTVCLDNCHLKEGNYYLLLEKASSLKNISLSRCGINDVTVSMIAEKLAHPMPASSVLLTLNLSTNRITDIGAKNIGDALRTNGKLAYLNLAGNMISDEGAKYILNSLTEFLVTEEELMRTRRSKMQYYKERNALISQVQKDIHASDIDKKTAKKKSTKMPILTPKKGKALEPEKSFNFDQCNYDKAEAVVDSIKGPFKDPYSPENVVVKAGEVFSLGNHSLCYLNLAYNHLTYRSLQKLLDVLEYQNYRKGLVNVCLEGNLLPERCVELTEIDKILERALTSFAKQSYSFGPFRQRKPSKFLPR